MFLFKHTFKIDNGLLVLVVGGCCVAPNTTFQTLFKTTSSAHFCYQHILSIFRLCSTRRNISSDNNDKTMTLGINNLELLQTENYRVKIRKRDKVSLM